MWQEFTHNYILLLFDHAELLPPIPTFNISKYTDNLIEHKINMINYLHKRVNIA